MAVALLVAAGRGERLGSGGPKALVPVAGRPLMDWSLAALQASPRIEAIVVALPEGVAAPAGTTGVPGGRERSHSVRAALAAAPVPADGLVLVQDAARPMLTPELVEDCLTAVAREGVDAVVAAAPVSDTIKRADADGRVVATLDRAELWAVQTPQAFRHEALVRALSAGDEVLAAATDDAGLIERAGGTVRVVPASPENLKVTTPVDLELAALLLQRR